MTVGELLDAYASVGLDIYLDSDDQLRVRGPQRLRDAARPKLKRLKADLIEYLKAERATAVERLIVNGMTRSSRGTPA